MAAESTQCLLWQTLGLIGQSRMTITDQACKSVIGEAFDESFSGITGFMRRKHLPCERREHEQPHMPLP